MKLRKSIHKTHTDFYNKFEDCDPKLLERGDYISLHFLSLNQKRRGGSNFRIGTRIVLLYRKKA